MKTFMQWLLVFGPLCAFVAFVFWVFPWLLVAMIGTILYVAGVAYAFDVGDDQPGNYYTVPKEHTL